MELLLRLAGPILQWASKFAAPLLAYLKGRSDAKQKQELKADEQFIQKVSDAADARNGRMPDSAGDPNNRDNRG